jgi:hypothetical protein
MTVDALRSAADQAAVPLTVGAGVKLGVRRMHALPTPISSFHLMATDGEEASSLAESALLMQLVRSMQARVIRHDDPAQRNERMDAGICVLPLHANTPTALRAAVANGARRILCIPRSAPLPLRMLIHAGDTARRSDLLALVSSVMRHLPVATTAVTVQRAEASRSEMLEAQRLLLDTRADLRGAHGLDLRGERFIGDRTAWLSQLSTQSDPVLVVMGLPGRMSELSASLPRDHAPLFTSASHATVLFAIDPVS